MGNRGEHLICDDKLDAPFSDALGEEAGFSCLAIKVFLSSLKMARSPYFDNSFEDFDDLDSQHEVLGGSMCCPLRYRRSHPRHNLCLLNIYFNVTSHHSSLLILENPRQRQS